jgi:hypothetical protein
MPTEDAAAFQASWADAVAKGRAFAAEFRLYDRASGGYRWHSGGWRRCATTRAR